jgi:hypothetical protein
MWREINNKTTQAWIKQWRVHKEKSKEICKIAIDQNKAPVLNFKWNQNVTKCFWTNGTQTTKLVLDKYIRQGSIEWKKAFTIFFIQLIIDAMIDTYLKLQ